MIRLHLPKSKDSFFINVQGPGYAGMVHSAVLLGPYGPDFESDEQVVEIRSPQDSISKKGISLFEDNGVSHLQTEGDIFYSPLLKQMKPVYFDYSGGRTLRGYQIPGHFFGPRPMTGGHYALKTSSVPNGNTRNDDWYSSNVIRVNGQPAVEFLSTDFKYRGYHEIRSNFRKHPNYSFTTICDIEFRIYSYQGPVSHIVAGKEVETLGSIRRGISAIAAGHGTSAFGKTTIRKTIGAPGGQIVRSSATPSLSIAATKRSLHAISRPSLLSDLRPMRPHGDLFAAAVDRDRLLDSNMIEFLTELTKVKTLVPKLKNLGKLKTHASNYLSLKYGVLPTLEDLKSIFDVFSNSREVVRDKNDHRLINGGQTEFDVVDDCVITRTNRIKVAVEPIPAGFHSFWDGLDRYGLQPNLTNIWDLIPFSFVIDWYVGIGDYFERTDSKVRTVTLPVAYSTSSVKEHLSNYPILHIEDGLMGTLEWSNYRRWVSHGAPLPSLSSEFTPTYKDHWVEQGALILALKK